MVYDKYASNNKHDIFIHVNVKENKIKQETYELCNRIFDSKRTYNCGSQDQIEQCVDFIRTIFKDYEIEGIIVHLKGKNDYTSITLKNNQVIKFEKREIKDFGQLNFVYDEKGTKLYTDNYDINEISTKEEFNNLFNHSVEIIKNINENKTIELGHIEKGIINIYKEFYGKYPDLSKKDEYLRVQPMMWLINRKNANYNQFFGDYTIRYNGKPTSYKLKSFTDKIVPFGQIDEELSIEDKYTYYYQNIGKIVTNYINKYKDSQEILDNIALTSYIIGRMVPNFYEIEDIVAASNDRLNYEQVEEILEFLTNLDISLQSDNPLETYKELEKNNKVKEKYKK